jgi:hypothetical protein
MKELFRGIKLRWCERAQSSGVTQTESMKGWIVIPHRRTFFYRGSVPRPRMLRIKSVMNCAVLTLSPPLCVSSALAYSE